MRWTRRTVTDFERRTRAWSSTWELYDEPLRRICRAYRTHERFDAVVAKVGLVQRAYEAGLERHVRGDGGARLLVVARALLRHRSSIDAAIDELAYIVGRGDRFDARRLSVVLRAHGVMLRALEGTTRDGNVPRSFASKYLHFHCGGVPIYDQRVANFIKRRDWYGLERTDALIARYAVPMPHAYDGQYARFCLQFLSMWTDARNAGAILTVRKLDAYLISNSEELRGR